MYLVYLTYLSVCLSIYLPVCLCIYPSFHLSKSPSIYLSIHLSIFPSIHPSIHLIHLSIYLSLSLSIHIYIYIHTYHHISACALYIYIHTAHTNVINMATRFLTLEVRLDGPMAWTWILEIFNHHGSPKMFKPWSPCWLMLVIISLLGNRWKPCIAPNPLDHRFMFFKSPESRPSDRNTMALSNLLNTFKEHHDELLYLE